MTDDVRVPINQMSQAWSDIRGYTSNMWQIAALCLTVVALSLNIFVGSISSITPPPTWTWQAVIVLAFAFVIITIYTIQWLRSSIVRRIVYIMKTEETIAGISSKRSVTGSAELFSVTEGPMKALLYFFYFLGSLLGILAIYPLFEILVSTPLTTEQWILLLSLASASLSTLLGLFRNYRNLRKRERLVGETAETAAEFEETSTDITPLKMVYANTVMKRVFGNNWYKCDLSLWTSKNNGPWKIQTHSVHFPESLQLLELPYAPIYEFIIGPNGFEQYSSVEGLLQNYPQLENVANQLAEGITSLSLTSLDVDLLIIIRALEDKDISAKEVFEVLKEISSIMDEFVVDFSEK